MKKYIFKKDLTVARGSKKIKFKKGDVKELTKEQYTLFNFNNTLEEYNETVKEIKERLDNMGVEYTSNAKKADLLELLEESQ